MNVRQSGVSGPLRRHACLTQRTSKARSTQPWIPAFAGMTRKLRAGVSPSRPRRFLAFPDGPPRRFLAFPVGPTALRAAFLLSLSGPRPSSPLAGLPLPLVERGQGWGIGSERPHAVAGWPQALHPSFRAPVSRLLSLPYCTPFPSFLRKQESRAARRGVDGCPRRSLCSHPPLEGSPAPGPGGPTSPFRGRRGGR